ncbi:hypothetical protein FRC03_008269, partial [Tulasnella sp. 419]
MSSHERLTIMIEIPSLLISTTTSKMRYLTILVLILFNMLFIIETVLSTTTAPSLSIGKVVRFAAGEQPQRLSLPSPPFDLLSANVSTIVNMLQVMDIHGGWPVRFILPHLKESALPVPVIYIPTSSLSTIPA